MSATQQVSVLGHDGDVVRLRVYVIHPDEGDLYPEPTTVLQWLIAGLPHDSWNLAGVAPSNTDVPPLAGLLTKARVTTQPQLAWWLLENGRRVVQVKTLAERNLDARDSGGSWVLDLDNLDALPHLDVEVMLGTEALVAHCAVGQTWECAPFSPLSASPSPPPPGRQPTTSRKARPTLSSVLASHEGTTLELGFTLDWRAEDASRLAQWPGLTGLESLSIDRSVGDAAIVELALAPFDRLRSLRFTCSGLRGTGLTALATSSTFPMLDTLQVIEDMLADSVLNLRSTPLWGRLRSLELTAVELTDSVAVELLRSPPPNLQSLALTSNFLRDPAVLLAIAELPNLRELSLAGEAYDEEALLPVLRGDSLTGLTLTGTSLSDIGLTALMGSPQWAALRQLDLSNTHLDDDSIGALADGPVAPALEELRLYNVPFGLETLRRIASCAGLPALARLGLGMNGFEPSDVSDADMHGVAVTFGM